ncbi:hypothetical protein SLEP1_g27382 [Rubroshorea leprosula]|uniref:Uncharacterized protein n=1 Tax=Rubroshorea leprosula TaxID=152421 RepID=A0AAV5JVS0_9ROSI|nr:hypothetical protein SLEP1_g27382 [Rubroshorea leprosula]
MFDELLQILISAAASALRRQEKKRSGGGDEADENAMIDGGDEEEVLGGGDEANEDAVIDGGDEEEEEMSDEDDRLDAELCCRRRRWLRSGARRCSLPDPYLLQSIAWKNPMKLSDEAEGWPGGWDGLGVWSGSGGLTEANAGQLAKRANA